MAKMINGNAVIGERGANYNGEVWFKAATIAVPVCGALILFLLVAVAVRLLKADALLHADRKLRFEGGYMSPLAQHSPEDVKKVWVGTGAPLLVAPGGCLVAVERAHLVDCDIQR
ncbi:BMP and activin membrane-bound inhibitor-like protein [Operophtera brumata]|uniref:BMP and activin membrane-bound inhibitor-like protein n=1 Tax=Operophtera brumata TaxID=104452 RepID=A0A0L7KY46_OPEBR|nr:BMP and activin membrane-bound inhibitor-like protein [Operophtera brumata]